jgi:hypothetical protein
VFDCKFGAQEVELLRAQRVLALPEVRCVDVLARLF